MVAYFRPATLDEALAIRASRDVVVLAGGTDVYPARVARAGWGDMHHGDVLDISAVAGLRGIAEMPDHWRLGALTTWTDLIAAGLPPLFDGYRRAARDVGGIQIQNRATLAGNICTASPAGDGAPNLLALDAAVELASVAGRRTVPMSAFIQSYRRTQCRQDEIVTAILVPKRGAAARGHFLKLGARRYLVISIVMVAGVVEMDAAGIVTAAAIAIGSCSAVPQRVPLLEKALVGHPVAAADALVARDHFAPLAPVDDIRGSAAYRQEAAMALTRDLLSDLAVSVPQRAA